MTVHHITPGRADKNLGKAINQLIEHLPDDDWICLRDIDTIPAHHTEFFNQCEEIALNNEADVIGCVTNRLGLTHQLYNQKLSLNYDMKYHYQIGKERFEDHGSEVEILTDKTIGGCFMLFSKQTWQKIGKFKEGAIQINNEFVDYIFCKDAINKGLRIGLANGIYIYHSYRHWNANPRQYKHLK